MENKLKGPKVSAVMCTYRRALCVERSVNCFINQTYNQSELIIFNTDEQNPFKLSEALQHYNIKIVNCGIDYETRQPYTNVGAIRRDALTHATGEYYNCWDDDDIFLPWFIQQALDFIQTNSKLSFKPEKSFFYSGNDLRLVSNTLEASVVSCIKKIREYGFLLETGSEGLGWYTKMRDKRELDEHTKKYIPSYCFNWNDGQEMLASHKQSGDINNPSNFEIHKLRSNNFAINPIEKYTTEQFAAVCSVYFEFLKLNKEQFPRDAFENYVLPFVKK